MSLYGASFAQKLIDQGEYEQAVAEADRHAQREPDNPEPHHDRARALSMLARYEESFSAYARAIELDRSAGVLHDGEVDDGLFSTILGWSRSLPGVTEQLATLKRYGELLPGGSHHKEAEEWSLRLRGLLKTTFVKPRD